MSDETHIPGVVLDVEFLQETRDRNSNPSFANQDGDLRRQLLCRFYPMSVVDESTFREWIAAYPFQEEGLKRAAPSDKAWELKIGYDLLYVPLAVGAANGEYLPWRILALLIYDRLARGGFGILRWRSPISETESRLIRARFLVSRNLDIAEGRDVHHD